MARLSTNVSIHTVVGNGKKAASADEVERELRDAFEAFVEDVKHNGAAPGRPIRELETAVMEQTRVLGRFALLLALTVAEDAVETTRPQGAGRSFVRRDRKGKVLSTLFGSILYFRTYMGAAAREADRSGFHPTDSAHGITRDRFSMGVISTATRMATHLPFDTCANLLTELWGWSPAKDSIEEMVLGLGAHVEDYWEQAPPPPGDGDVLVVQADAKGAPMATEDELTKRRRPWGKEKRSPSPRHRGRARRQNRKNKIRRKPGDKSKNAKMANVVVLYTLRRDGDLLLGPLNKRVYSSFANKRSAFAFAAREAKRRGFDPKSKDAFIQFLSDGDKDLQLLADEFFPHAIQTLDLMHVLEYLWSAGNGRFRTGSIKLGAWVRKQKSRLLSGAEEEVVRSLTRMLSSATSKAGRERIEQARDYLAANLHRLDYKWAREMDLDIGTGAVEGAVKHTVGKRLDNGGMRWIAERAQATLQLRCIEINGEWQDFVSFVERRTRADLDRMRPVRILRSTPAPIRSHEDAEITREAA